MYPHPSIPKDVKDEEHSCNEPEAQRVSYSHPTGTGCQPSLILLELLVQTYTLNNGGFHVDCQLYTKAKVTVKGHDFDLFKQLRLFTYSCRIPQIYCNMIPFELQAHYTNAPNPSHP